MKNIVFLTILVTFGFVFSQKVAFTESFEGDTFPPAGWKVTNTEGAEASWSRNQGLDLDPENPASALNPVPYEGEYVAMVNSRGNGSGTTILELPALDFSEYTNIALEYQIFKHFWLGWPPAYDSLKVVAKVGDGEWNKIGRTEFCLDSDNKWNMVHLNMNDYTGLEDVTIGFQSDSNRVENIHIDNITLIVEMDESAPVVEKVAGGKAAVGDAISFNVTLTDVNGLPKTLDGEYSFDDFTTSELVQLTVTDTISGLLNLDGNKRYLYQVDIPQQNSAVEGVLRIKAEDNCANFEISEFDLKWYDPQINFSDGFESEDYIPFTQYFSPWETFDLDHYPVNLISGLEYPNFSNRNKSFEVFEKALTNQPADNETYDAFEGNRCIAAFKSNINNDWLITPAIKSTASTTLSFYAKQTSPYFMYGAVEKLVLLISENSSHPSKFVQLTDTISIASTDWQKYELDLTNIVNEMDHFYFAFNHATNHGMAHALLIDNVEIEGSSSISNELIPAEIELEQNYPNPFNPETTIKFSLNNTTNVKLVVFNAKGEKVASLINGSLAHGAHSVNFNGANLNSGVYYYTLETPAKSITKKMILIK